MVFDGFRAKSHSRLGKTHKYDPTANQASPTFLFSPRGNPQVRTPTATLTKPGAAKFRLWPGGNPHLRQRAPTRTTSVQTRPFRNPSVARIRSTFSTTWCDHSTSARPTLHQGPTNHQQPIKDQGVRFIEGVAGDLAAGVFNPATHRCRVKTAVLEGQG